MDQLQQLTGHGTGESHRNEFGRILGFTIPVSCFLAEPGSPHPTTKRQLEGPQQLLGSELTCQGAQI